MLFVGTKMRLFDNVLNFSNMSINVKAVFKNLTFYLEFRKKFLKFVYNLICQTQ